MTTIQTLIEAFEAGRVSLAQLSDLAGFEFEADSFDCLSENDAADYLVELGMIEAPVAGDIHEMNDAAMRQRARFASIRGA